MWVQRGLRGRGSGLESAPRPTLKVLVYARGGWGLVGQRAPPCRCQAGTGLGQGGAEGRVRPTGAPGTTQALRPMASDLWG